MSGHFSKPRSQPGPRGPRVSAEALPGGAPPRYLVVAQALMRDIESGAIKVGDMLPTEADICQNFGISRHTAREAIRRLTEAGLVTRRAGVGTTVRARTAQSRYTARVSDLTELFVYNREARLEVLSEGPVTVRGELARVLPGCEGQRWYRFVALRRVDGASEPLVYTEILVAPGYESIRDHIREPGVMVYELIEKLHGERVVELRQAISCLGLPGRIGAILGARAGTPALRVLRYYVGAHDRPLSVSINTYPHDRFNLVTRWRLDWDGARA